MSGLILTYHYKLLPTRVQRRALERILEDQRQLYNAALEERREAWRKFERTITWIDQFRSLTECRRDLPDMRAIPVNLQRFTLKLLQNTYEGFFRRVKHGQNAGFPRFKSAGRFRCFGFAEMDGIRIREKRLLFRGMPGSLRIHMHRPLPAGARIVSCSFKCIKTDEWTISFHFWSSCPDENNTVHSSVGVDLGLRTLAALSDGTLIRNPRFANRAANLVRIHQRALARCQTKSNRRGKVKRKLMRLYRKVASSRRTYLHQVSAKLVRDFDLIAIEALDVRSLAQTDYARSIHDAGWGILIDMLRYKAERAGVALIEVDPSRTSQTCPACSKIAPKSLWQRTHDCSCGYKTCRDVAAAQVILGKAIVGLGAANVIQRDVRRLGNIT